MARIDNKLEILGKELLYAKLHLYLSLMRLALLGYSGGTESGPEGCPDFSCQDLAFGR